MAYNDCIDEWFIGDGFRDTAAKVISSSCGFDEYDSIEVLCERYLSHNYFDYCVMSGRTAINSTNFVIGDLKFEDVEGIIFENNKDIEYLPYKIYMQLPNLIFYNASRCSIKQVSKENFEILNRLKFIELQLNQIQKISGNTFKGLRSLRHINLSRFLIP